MNTTTKRIEIDNSTVKVQHFEMVHFRDKVKGENGKAQDREVLILYALGENGIIYEYTGGKWLGLPINQSTIREVTQ